MSDSLLPDDRVAQPSADAPLEQSIDAEIADHLAAAAAQLQREGLPADAAQRHALDRFGNVQTVRNRVWWIHRGEEVMLRAAAIALAIALTLGLLVVGYGGWHLQHSFDDRMNQLAAQLDALNQTQRKLLDQQVAPESPRIVGRVYLADVTQPAVGATVQICRVSSEIQYTNNERKLPEVVRNLRADAQGRFDSGPLGDGDYFVFAPLVPVDPAIGSLKGYYTQTEPIYLYGGRAPHLIELDVRLKSGRLRFDLSEKLASQFDLPDTTQRPKPVLVVAMQLITQSQSHQTLPWSPLESQPAQWPMHGRRSTFVRPLHALPRNLPLVLDLPVGTYRVSAEVTAGLPSANMYAEDNDSRLADRVLLNADGRRGRTSLAAKDDSVVTMAGIQEGQETAVVVQVPEGYEQQLREASQSWQPGAPAPEALHAKYWPVKPISQ